MSIFDTLFGSSTAPAATAPEGTSAPAAPAAPAASTTSTAEGASTSQDAAKENKSPLDQYTELWKNDPTKKADQSSTVFNVDQQKLLEAASKVDFTKAITPDMLAAIKAGGEGANEAFIDAINKVSQLNYAQSTLAASKIVEQALAQAEVKFAERVPNMIKRQQASDSLITANPALSHPAAQPIIYAIQHQMAAKYPDATPTELQRMATEYLENFANLAMPKKPETTKSQSVKNETDWSEWL